MKKIDYKEFFHYYGKRLRVSEVLKTHQVFYTRPEKFNDPFELPKTILDSISPLELGVFCLTTCPKSILMWSHYASEHRGICLGFAVKNNQQELPHKVSYSYEHPSQQGKTQTLTTKAQCWEYEQEHRIIRPFTNSENSYGFLDASPGTISRIIFGCRFTDNYRENDLDETKHSAECFLQRTLDRFFAVDSSECTKKLWKKMKDPDNAPPKPSKIDEQIDMKQGVLLQQAVMVPNSYRLQLVTLDRIKLK